MDRFYVEKYKEYQKKNFWFVARRKMLSKVYEKHGPVNGSNLNIGAGYGYDNDVFASVRQVYSLDIEKEMCEYIVANRGEVCIQGSAVHLPVKSCSMDSACLLDIIEHIDDDRGAIAEALRILKPGGCLFVTVPAHQFLFGKHDIVNRHLRRYSKDEVLDLMNREDAKVVFASYFSTLLFLPLLFFRLADRFGVWDKMKKDDGSDFSIMGDGAVNRVLTAFTSLEAHLVTSRLLLFGSSILVVVRKNP